MFCTLSMSFGGFSMWIEDVGQESSAWKSLKKINFVKDSSVAAGQLQYSICYQKAFRVGPAAAAVHKQHTVIQAARIYGGSRETCTHLQGLGPLLLGAGCLGWATTAALPIPPAYMAACFPMPWMVVSQVRDWRWRMGASCLRTGVSWYRCPSIALCKNLEGQEQPNRANAVVRRS